MNTTLRNILIVFGATVTGAALLLVGVLVGLSTWRTAGSWLGGMMSGNFTPVGLRADQSRFNQPIGPAMMQGFVRQGVDDPDFIPGFGMMNGYGMMGQGMMSTGMMGGFQSGGLLSTEPISLEDARLAVEEYVAGLENDDLVVGEVMIFDNHAYAQIIEASTGIGALEVLVDPATRAVYPEHGSNMMWNLKYSPMSGSGMRGMMGRTGQNFGGMMGGRFGAWSPADISVEMSVSPGEAVTAAQEYLDANLPGTEADDHADAFYGYYTLHIVQDGEVIGMLSVNGFSAQVFLHTWHGDFIEMADAGHD